MMTTLNAPTLLFWSNITLVLIGILALMMSTRFFVFSEWLTWLGFLFFFSALGIESGFFSNQEFHLNSWMTGWVLSRHDPLSIPVGIYQDPAAFVFSVLSCLTAVGLYLTMGSFKTALSQRSIGGLAISAGGVGLASISLTPWLLFVGLILTFFGGLTTFSSVWENDQEARIVSRFLWERAAGFLLAFFGACVLVSNGVSLFLNDSEVWTAGESTAVQLGAALLAGGLFMQMQSFPFFGRLVLDSRIFPPLRILVAQIYPAWVAFILLVRLEPQLVGLGLFPTLGWFALISSVLTVVSGMFHDDWRGSVSLWMAAGFSLACAVLAFSGKAPAIALLVGISLGALVISVMASALDQDVPSNSALKKRAYWVKVLLFFGSAAGCGMIGFVSAAGALTWIASAVDSPAELTLFLFALFSFIFLGWHLAWRVARFNSASAISWVAILASCVWILLSFGILWTGTPSGGVILGFPDRLFPSLLDQLFAKSTLSFKDATTFISASGLYWSVLLVAILAAYWSTGRKEDHWEKLRKVFPRLSRFVSVGYGFDHLVARIGNFLIAIGDFSVRFLDEKVWASWIPYGFSHGLNVGSKAFYRMDQMLSHVLREGMRRLVEVPGKTLQLIHTGDLRWYLFFALSTGFALMAHYLRR